MELDLSTQAVLVAGLKPQLALASDGVEHLQTHISHVLLAGQFAYKLKKPLNLGFLDFSTLAQRQHCCNEEIRLNSRLAPSVYLDVVPITGTLEQPLINGNDNILDYAVRMRRFPQEALLNQQTPSPTLIERIAERVAAFHQVIPTAPEDSAFGTPEAVFFPMQQNFDQIRGLISAAEAQAQLLPLEKWTQACYQAVRTLLATRRATGHIRECHGDMHLGNIAWINGELAIFDGIEFNPDLRWIDTLNEIAFLVMDLEQAGHDALARRLLNRYLEVSGDYTALPLLDFYKVYRALVRAKVTAFRLQQTDLSTAEREQVLAEYSRYINLASAYTVPRRTAVLITHGVSGSGKTRLGMALVETLGVLRLRSDVERKRLFGLAETACSGSAPTAGIYHSDANIQTYVRLIELAREVLSAGYPVLLDATFLKHSQRQAAADLAAEYQRPLIILDLYATETVLRERVARRLAKGSDASEANLEVLEQQLATREPLHTTELAQAIRWHYPDPLPLEYLQARLAN